MTTNYAVASGATATSGTSADAAYPWTNLATRDRYKVGRSAAAVSSITVEGNLNGSKTIQAIALHSYRCGAATAITSVVIKYGGTSPPGTTIATINTPSLTGRDVGYCHSGTFAAAYVSFTFNLTGSGIFEAGKLAAGPIVDCGSAPSPGSGDTIATRRVMSETADGGVIVYAGFDSGRAFQVSIEKAALSVGDALEAVAGAGLPVSYFDLKDRTYEVIVDSLARNDLYNVSPTSGIESIGLQMTRLP